MLFYVNVGFSGLKLHFHFSQDVLFISYNIFPKFILFRLHLIEHVFIRF